MKSRLFADLLPLLGPIVSVFGLLSCTQHGSPTADSWALPAPQLHETATGTSRAFMTSLTEPISADSDMVFPGALASFADVTIDVTSNCTSSLGSQSGVLHLKGVNVIPVREFLPAPLWRRLDLPTAKSVTCSVKFSAKNKTGSTHNFEIAGVQFTHLERLENLAIQDTRLGRSLFDQELDAKLANEKTTVTLHAKSAANYEFLQPVSDGAATSFDLICERFRNHRETGPEQPYTNVLHELMMENVERSGDEVQLPEPMNQTLFTNQRCRIVTMSTETKTGLKNILMTPPFKLQFPLPTVKIKETALALQPGTGNILQGKVAYSIVIENPTTATQAFRVANLIGNDLRLQNLHWKSNQIYTSKVIPVDRVETRVVGSDRTWQDDGTIVFEIGSGKKAEIQVILASTPVTCIIGSVDYVKATIYKEPDFGFSVGFKMKWIRPLLVERYLNWDPNQPLFSNEKAQLPLSKEFNESIDEDGGHFPSPLLSEIFKTKKLTDLDFTQEKTYTMCFQGSPLENNPNWMY
jgi:hypothetical protein